MMSTATNPTFEIVILLASHGKIIAEFKRLDLEPDQEKSSIYRWILFDVEKTQVQNLEFLDQDNEEGVEYREFEQGNLSFDSNVGQLLLNDGMGFALDRLAPDDIDPNHLISIQQFLLK
jgi:hypothetical protein